MVVGGFGVAALVEILSPPAFAGGGARSTLVPKKEKAIEISLNGLYLCRQLPTLPHTFACSTIGPAGLNFRVRDGNGWIPRGKITDNLIARCAREGC